MTADPAGYETLDEITVEYRTLLERGRVESWTFLNSMSDEPDPWWSALEQLAAADGLRVKRGSNDYGDKELVVPELRLVQPEGGDYVAQDLSSTEAVAAELEQRMLDDWGDTITSARAGHGAISPG